MIETDQHSLNNYQEELLECNGQISLFCFLFIVIVGCSNKTTHERMQTSRTRSTNLPLSDRIKHPFAARPRKDVLSKNSELIRGLESRIKLNTITGIRKSSRINKSTSERNRKISSQARKSQTTSKFDYASGGN